ncbi:MAG: tubulin/FtsZ family protein [Methanophagales archaeon]|nr:tubulin/FtsZ family protein [Methanophagales archaeon]MCW3140924.1 tubulin/FtsZ family protein [Methanophagales archaeon]
MRVFVIGYGQAGGRIADAFLEFAKRTGQNFIIRALAINTAKSDLIGIKNIPMEDRLLIGESLTKGHGIGADNELGAKVATDEIYTIQSAIDKRGTHQVDAFLVIAGLGGGTGSGGAPVLARRLKKLYEEPVYGLGILPAKEEGSLYSLNAARSLMTFMKEVDNLFLFDNDAWKTGGETVKEAFADINEEIVRRFGILFGAGEANEVGQMVVDAAEIINTLKGGGISTIGYAAEEIGSEGLLKKFFGKKGTLEKIDAVTRITSLTRRAIAGRLTIPCDVSTAERALIIAAGPPKELSRKGMEKSKERVEEMIRGTEVRGGDFPVVRSDHVAAVVLLSGVSDIPRVKEIQELGAEAQEKLKAVSSEKEREYKDLMDTNDTIKPLF